MKLPKPKKLPSGSWNVNVMVDGRRVSVTRSTEKECVAAAAELKAGLKQVSNPARMTVGNAIDRYIESRDSVLSPSTVAGYRRLRANALQDIMDIRVADITQERIQRSINLTAREKSPKTVRNAHGLLAAALTEQRPDLHLRTRLPQKVKYDITIPTEDDIFAIVFAARGSSIELPVMLAVWLGLRMSEIIGLKWDDIDGDVLHIRHALVDEGEKATKTSSSKRDIIIPPYLKDLLDKTPHTDEHIIPLTRRTIYDRFQRRCRKAGIKHYRFHDLRHINASVMLALGVPNKYAQERMGHATDNMLKNVYQHTMTEHQKAVADEIDNYFNEKLQMILHTENLKSK